MLTVDENTAKLAVLIDADNAQPAIIEGLLAEIATYGTAHVKRAYGDWTGTSLRGWKDHLLAQSIQPIQQFAYTMGKNATDAALIIDAMGPALHGPVRRVLHRVQRRRLHSFGLTHPGVRVDGVRVRGAQDTQAVRRGLRQVHLHREPHLPGRSGHGTRNHPLATMPRSWCCRTRYARSPMDTPDFRIPTLQRSAGSSPAVAASTAAA
jgi:NYN domain